MKYRLCVVIASVALVSCQTTKPEPNAPMFARADCKRPDKYPEVQSDYQLAVEVCMYRALAGAQAGVTPIRGGGIAGSLERAIVGNQIATNLAISCMAERGYLYRRISEHVAMCAHVNTLPSAKRR